MWQFCLTHKMRQVSVSFFLVCEKESPYLHGKENAMCIAPPRLCIFTCVKSKHMIRWLQNTSFLSLFLLQKIGNVTTLNKSLHKIFYNNLIQPSPWNATKSYFGFKRTIMIYSIEVRTIESAVDIYEPA